MKRRSSSSWRFESWSAVPGWTIEDAASRQLVLLDRPVLAHVDRERAGEDDEDLLLDRVDVAAATAPGG